MPERAVVADLYRLLLCFFVVCRGDRLLLKHEKGGVAERERRRFPSKGGKPSAEEIFSGKTKLAKKQEQV